MDLEVLDDSFSISNEMWTIKMQDKIQNTKAHELAGFVRGYAIANAPSFGDYAKSRYKNSSWQCAYERLADEIESLGEQDGIPYPLDVDGMPIKPGDIVYFCNDLRKETEKRIVEGIRDKDFYFYISDDNEYAIGSALMCSHKKPRTLDDIIREIRNAFYEDELRIDLVHEAYELGKKETE